MYCTDLLQVCVSHSKEECHTTYEEVCKPVYHKPTYQTAAHNGKQCEQVPKKECKYVQVIISNDSKGRLSPLLNSPLCQVPECSRVPYEQCDEGYEDKCTETPRTVAGKVTKHRCVWPKRSFYDDKRC